MAPDFSAPYVADSTAPPWHFWSRDPVPLTILSFWATWCKPCETLHPWMEALARTYAAAGRTRGDHQHARAGGLDPPVLAADSGSVTLDVLDPDGHITELYSVTSVPTTLLVAENNVVRAPVGGRTGRDERHRAGDEPSPSAAASAAKPASRGCSE